MHACMQPAFRNREKTEIVLPFKIYCRGIMGQSAFGFVVLQLGCKSSVVYTHDGSPFSFFPCSV